MRRLPQSLSVGAAETLPGYLDRLAWYLDLPLGVLYRSVGLAPESGPVRRISGVSLPQETQARIAHATGVAVEQITATLLDQFENAVYLPHPEDQQFGLATWAYTSTSLCCPGCLAGTGEYESTGIWRLPWRFVWSFACVHHKRLLLARCPGCGCLLGGAQKDGSRGFASSSFVADPARCTATIRGSGWLAERCGQCLTEVRTPSLARNARLLRTQETINAALSGSAIPVGDALLPSHIFFSELRSLAGLVFQLGTLEHLGSLPPAARETFELFAAQRAEVRIENEARPRTRRFRGYRLPHEPALVAAVLPLCAEIVCAPTSTEMAKRLAPIAESACAGRTQVPRFLMTYYGFDDRLRDVFEECVRPRTTLSYVLRSRTALSDSGLSVSHVPQLFWADLYETYLSTFLPGVHVTTARQFASASLCRSLGVPQWSAVCELLEFRSGPGALMRCAGIIRRAGNRLAYVSALEAAVTAMGERHRRDYAALRHALDGFAEVPADVWLSVLPDEPRSWVRATTRRYAAAWLWAELTSGDYRLSPGMRLIVAQPSRARYRASQAQAAYRMWVKTTISEQLAADLRAYGEALAAGTAVSSAL